MFLFEDYYMKLRGDGFFGYFEEAPDSGRGRPSFVEYSYDPNRGDGFPTFLSEALYIQRKARSPFFYCPFRYQYTAPGFGATQHLTILT